MGFDVSIDIYLFIHFHSLEKITVEVFDFTNGDDSLISHDVSNNIYSFIFTLYMKNKTHLWLYLGCRSRVTGPGHLRVDQGRGRVGLPHFNRSLLWQPHRRSLQHPPCEFSYFIDRNTLGSRYPYYRYRINYPYLKSTDKWISTDGESCKGGPVTVLVRIPGTQCNKLIQHLNKWIH